MASCNITVDVKIGPTLKLAMELVKLAAEVADVIPDYVPERADLIARLEAFHAHCLKSIRSHNDE